MAEPTQSNDFEAVGYGVQRSTNPLVGNDQSSSRECPPSTEKDVNMTSEECALEERLELMQRVMVQKGLMDVGASNKDLRLLLNTGKSTGNGGAKSQSNRTGDGQPKVRNQGKDIVSNPSTSEMTIYRKAVQTIAPEINGEIEACLNRVRTQTVESDTSQKISSSSDELMDISDENVSGE